MNGVFFFLLLLQSPLLCSFFLPFVVTIRHAPLPPSPSHIPFPPVLSRSRDWIFRGGIGACECGEIVVGFRRKGRHRNGVKRSGNGPVKWMGICCVLHWLPRSGALARNSPGISAVFMSRCALKSPHSDSRLIKPKSRERERKKEEALERKRPTKYFGCTHRPPKTICVRTPPQTQERKSQI